MTNVPLRDQLHHQSVVLPETISLGLRRHADGTLAFHKPQLSLSSYLDTTVLPPAQVSRPHRGLVWRMLLNDSLGDCVPVGKLHAIMDFHANARTRVPVFRNADAQLWYEKDGGYDPSDPNSDQGCDESVAMVNWEAGMPRTSDGVVHRIVGTIAVDAKNLTEVRAGINEFGGVVDGVDLPVTAQGQTEWTVIGDGKTGDSAPGSWGGHCTWSREYDAETFGLVTWGQEILETVEFRTAYHSEAHVVVTKEMLSKTGLGPSGVAWNDLLHDLKKFLPASSQ